jgi:hypothetical protein
MSRRENSLHRTARQRTIRIDAKGKMRVLCWEMVSLRILKWVRWQKEEGVKMRSCGEVKSKSQKEVRR